MSLRTQIRTAVNNVLDHVGLQVVSSMSTDPARPAFIGAKQTIAGARRESLTVSEFIDRNSATPGATQATVECLVETMGSLDVRRVCEIGPGSGRYSDLLIRRYHPMSYEIYESAKDWVPYLQATYPVTVRPCDGYRLSGTETGSVDLVHAEKVLCYLPIAVTASYLEEMTRVVRPGGFIAFDAVTERCLADDAVAVWVANRISLFTMTSRAWLVDYLARRGAVEQRSLLVPMSGASTEFMIFRKSAA